MKQSVRHLGRYYDWAKCRALTPEDGCALSEWEDSYPHKGFAVHPDGCLVFLTPSEIEQQDKYGEGRWYSTERDLKSAFHSRRVTCTVEILKKALVGLQEPRVLDVACGLGIITGAVRDGLGEAEVSGVDVSLTAITRAAKTQDSIEFAVADARNLPYTADYFDAVVLNNVIEHVACPAQVLAQAGKVLKAGGHLVISTPSRYRLENLARVLGGRRAKRMSEDHVTEYTVGQIKDYLEFSGFDVCGVLSKPLRRKARSWKGFVVFSLVRPVLECWVRALGSHHSLESTVFVHAVKRGPR